MPAKKPTQKIGQPTARAKTQKYAGFIDRCAAGLIDGIILSAIMFGVYVPIMTPHFIDTLGNNYLEIILNMQHELGRIAALLGMIYCIGLLSWRQQTIGMMAFNMTITDKNGKPPSVPRITGWYFARIISMITLYIGFFMIGWTAKKQGLHDKICGTLFIVK